MRGFILLAIIAYFVFMLYGLFNLFQVSVFGGVFTIFVVAGLTMLALNNQ